MKNGILIILAALCLMSCTDRRGTIRALEKRGYTDITVKGYRPFGCGFMLDKMYMTHTGFEAMNKNGEMVKGCVCNGLITTVKVYK